ncbi:MAG: hypothetical protein COA79_09430 [Planctomycetota bacterium]|nr:MAG: hypothetical protein COA79_09430 [Planctomycetota bacterium]
MKYTVYLSGEIHSNWREEIVQLCQNKNLTIEFLSPITDHEKSDSVGEVILGKEEDSFWYDNKSSKINAIRTKTMIEKSDVVIVRFGEKYKQWNAAFDAGYANAKGKPVITLHSKSLIHPLKEVNSNAYASAETTEQVCEILAYILSD